MVDAVDLIEIERREDLKQPSSEENFPVEFDRFHSRHLYHFNGIRLNVVGFRTPQINSSNSTDLTSLVICETFDFNWPDSVINDRQITKEARENVNCSLY